MGSEGQIFYAVRDRVATITIDNPLKKNAITGPMSERLEADLRRADRSEDVSVIVLTGSRGTFSSGHDLNEVLERPELAWDLEQNAVFGLPLELDKPVIAAIDGPAYAAGLILALHCDIRVASDRATFCSSGARLGMVPIGRQVLLLSRLMPPGHGLRMLLGAQPIDADIALQTGLVQWVESHATFSERVQEEAAVIAQNSDLALAGIKRLYRACLDTGSSDYSESESKLARAAAESEEFDRRIGDLLQARAEK